MTEVVAAERTDVESATNDAGPASEREVALDMARRALPVAPIAIGLAALPWGVAGAASVAFALALVVGNFLVAAWLLGTAARISYTLVMVTVLFGYLVRLGLIAVAVLLVADASWVEPVALGVTLIVAHLGLLAWELRYVSASLAYPGLRPTGPTALATKETAPR